MFLIFLISLMIGIPILSARGRVEHICQAGSTNTAAPVRLTMAKV